MASTTTVLPSSNMSAELGTQNPRRGEGTSIHVHNVERGEVRDAPQRESPRGGRGRGRGQRGSRGNGRGNQRAPQRSDGVARQSPPKPPPPGLGGGGISGGHSTGDAVPTKSVAIERVQEDEGKEEVEAEVCFICASPVVHNSVAPCNHRTCHICALRLRALYKTRACAHCRVSFVASCPRVDHHANNEQTEAKYVIFTDNATKRFEDFVDDDIQENDEVLGIKYEQKEIYDDTVLLLRYNCPAADCDVACWGWPDLHRHVKSVHHKQLCDLCTRNKKVFTHEHELFTQQELRKHEKFGDDNPGAVDQSGFKGHPQCGFCLERFYGDDELYSHCRDKHERCHICDRRNEGRQQQYYQDYNALEKHFRQDHFLCADQECMEKKFVVFESEMDLKAHQLEAHPNGLTKDARRDARRVDMSGFDYRTPHQELRGGRGSRPGRGRGRDPNAEALPASTAQPLRRDELAYHRQIAIQSSQSVTPRTFGGQLTTADTARDQNPASNSIRQNRSSPSIPAVETLSLNPNPQSASQQQRTGTPQEQARQLQHASVMDRASSMLRNDTSKLADFRTRVSSYRTSNITAPQLIDSFQTLFDVFPTDLGKLIKELADIYENESKRTALLKAWNDWRAINEDYPTLPGPSGVLPGSTAATTGTGGRRVLKLKSSTAQSSRSAVSKQGSWGNNIAVGGSQLPRTSGPAAAGANRSGGGGHTPAWVASASVARPSPASAPSSRPASRPTTSGVTTASGNAFPALPQAAKPNTLMMGLTRGTVRWDDARLMGPTAPAWGAAGRGNGGNSVSNVSGGAPLDSGTIEGGEGDTTGKGKGKKAKKQTLYKFG